MGCERAEFTQCEHRVRQERGACAGCEYNITIEWRVHGMDRTRQPALCHYGHALCLCLGEFGVGGDDRKGCVLARITFAAKREGVGRQ